MARGGGGGEDRLASPGEHIFLTSWLATNPATVLIDGLICVYTGYPEL